MSRAQSWMRRGAAAMVAAAALTMAAPPAALAAPNWVYWDGPTVDYSNQWDSNQWAEPTRSTDSTSAAALPASTESAPAARSDIATQIFELTNVERTKAGLQPLRRNDCLNASAQNWSERMSSEGRIYHSDLSTWMGSCSLSSAGENVAFGGQSAAHTVQMWMNSPGHRKNILSPDYTQLGVGVAGTYATQQFAG